MPDITRWLRTIVFGESAILSRLDRIHEEIHSMSTQNEEVAELVAGIAEDQTSLRQSLSGVAGDVSYLKAKLDALPAGQPLDEGTLADLRSTADSVHEVTQSFADLDAETDSSEPADDPAPPVAE